MSGRKRRLQPRRAGSDGNENLAHPSFTLNVPPTPQPSLAQDSAKQEATPSPSLSFGCFTFPDDELMLPIMPLPKVKLPTDLITLNLFEPRYRTMFKLVAQQKCRLFGITYVDRAKQTIESVGALCDLTHFVPHPEKGKIFVMARCVGRFRVRQLLNDKPFLTAIVTRVYDDQPGTEKVSEPAAPAGLDGDVGAAAPAAGPSGRQGKAEASAERRAGPGLERVQAEAEQQSSRSAAGGSVAASRPAPPLAEQAVRPNPEGSSADSAPPLRPFAEGQQPVASSADHDGYTHGSNAPGEEASGSESAAELEARVWQAMEEVRRLAGKVYAGSLSEPLGDSVFSAAVRRWCPDPSVLSNPNVPLTDFETVDAIERLGLLGDPATLGERLREFVVKGDSREEVSDAERRSRFSFAVARSLEIDDAVLQRLMYVTSTAERLRLLEAVLLEGRGYLAARSTLRDTLS